VKKKVMVRAYKRDYKKIIRWRPS